MQSTQQASQKFSDGAYDTCVKNWETLLGHFDRGEKDQLMKSLCESNGTQKLGADRSTASATECISSNAVAFIESNGDDETQVAQGANAICEQLCKAWPALSDDSKESSLRSKITKSMVLEPSPGQKLVLLTIERPATTENDEVARFYVSAMVCCSDMKDSKSVSNEATPTEASTGSLSKAGRGQLVHLHVSTAD